MTIKRINARSLSMVDVRGMLITSKPKKSVKKLATNQMSEQDILGSEDHQKKRYMSVNIILLSFRF